MRIFTRGRIVTSEHIGDAPSLTHDLLVWILSDRGHVHGQGAHLIDYDSGALRPLVDRSDAVSRRHWQLSQRDGH